MTKKQTKDWIKELLRAVIRGELTEDEVAQSIWNHIDINHIPLKSLKK